MAWDNLITVSSNLFAVWLGYYLTNKGVNRSTGRQKAIKAYVLMGRLNEEYLRELAIYRLLVGQKDLILVAKLNKKISSSASIEETKKFQEELGAVFRASDKMTNFTSLTNKLFQETTVSLVEELELIILESFYELNGLFSQVSDAIKGHHICLSDSIKLLTLTDGLEGEMVEELAKKLISSQEASKKVLLEVTELLKKTLNEGYINRSLWGKVMIYVVSKTRARDKKCN